MRAPARLLGEQRESRWQISERTRHNPSSLQTRRQPGRGFRLHQVTYWVGGKRREATQTGTLKEARALKRSRETDRGRGKLFRGKPSTFPRKNSGGDRTGLASTGDGRRGLAERTRERSTTARFEALRVPLPL